MIYLFLTAFIFSFNLYSASVKKAEPKVSTKPATTAPVQPGKKKKAVAMTPVVTKDKDEEIVAQLKSEITKFKAYMKKLSPSELPTPKQIKYIESKLSHMETQSAKLKHDADGLDDVIKNLKKDWQEPFSFYEEHSVTDYLPTVDQAIKSY